MTPEQAWSATLDQLRMEMPKATFNTWVRDTRFLNYSENVLTLGVQNSYARDWVESRLGSMIRRILIGIMACEVVLRFEVIPLQEQFPQDIGEKGVAPLKEIGFDKDEEKEEILVQLDTARQSLFETITQPERVTVVPGYFLRWVPYLGFQKSWMIVALWQTFYQNWGHKVSSGKTFSASGADIARWAGLSRRTVVTHLNTISTQDADNFFSWFVERVDSLAQEEHNGQATQFRFRTTMPLTPGDADSLTKVLSNLGIAENPVIALKKALECQPKELLTYPALRPQEIHKTNCGNPLTVQQIILKASGITPKNSQYIEVIKLAGELAGRLMPSKDVLVISHYFLLNWLPLLGSGPGWLVTLLRDEGYYDRKTGELRDKIRVEDGYTRLAQGLGIDRETTISEWLPTPLKRYGPQGKPGRERQERREIHREHVSQFLKKTNFRIDHSGKQKTIWEFHLRMTEPLIPEHQQIHDGLLEVLRDTFSSKETDGLKWLFDGQDLKDEAELGEPRWIEGHPANCTGQKPVTLQFSHRSPRDFHMRESSQHANFTGSPRELHRMIYPSPRDLHNLKLLINQHFSKAQIHLLEELTTALQSQPVNEPEKGAGLVHPGGELWDFERLLELDGTGEKRRKEICKIIAIRPDLGQRFLAWLLYAYAHRKTDRRKTGIESPFGYAFSRFEKVLPTAEYMAIAKHSPEELRMFLLHPHKTWDLPQYTQSLLKAIVQNGFLTLLDELCEDQTR